MRAEIRRFRASIDLPCDDRVLDALVEAWADGQCVYETPEERRRIEPQELAVEDADRHAQIYAAQNSSCYAGRWRAYEAGAPVLVVAFTGDLQAHRTALALPQVRIVGAERSFERLMKTMARLRTDPIEVPDAHVSAYGRSVCENAVVIRASGPAEAEAEAAMAAVLRERFGEDVQLNWNTRGPARRAAQ